MDKICFTCKESKDVSFFYSGNKECKKCHSEKMKEYRKLNPTSTVLVDSLDGEEWCFMKGFEQYHRISSFGRLTSLCKSVRKKAWPRKKEKLIKLQLGKKSGYYSYIFKWGQDKPKRFTIHRLVALHFIPNPENKPEVNHIGKDENGVITKLDNRVCSLEWATRPENIQHGFSNGLIKTPMGEKAHNCTLSNEQVLFIFNHKGSPRQLSRDLKMPYSRISSIRNGVSWNHITGAPKKYYGKEKDKPRYT